MSSGVSNYLFNSSSLVVQASHSVMSCSYAALAIPFAILSGMVYSVRRTDAVEADYELTGRVGLTGTHLVRAMDGIPEDKKEGFIQKLRELYPAGADGHDRAEILNEVAGIPALQRMEAVSRAVEIKKPDDRVAERISLLELEE